MNHFIAWTALGALVFLQPVASAVAADQGLGRTWAKLDTDKKLTIGYFGGSITDGTGASSEAKCWRALTTAWFKQQFPGATIKAINACIGGTGSDLGAFRCQRDLLSKSPDLVFIEFAVNDLGAKEGHSAYYEGVVRQILKANPATDIVQVYTINKQGDSYPNGTDPVTVAEEQKIADYYGLPSVNVGKALSEAIQSGKETWQTMTIDTTHPSDAGHRLYADTAIAFLQSHRQDVAAAPPDLLPPLHPDAAENATMVDAWDVETPGWNRESESLAGRFPHRISANTPGTELNYTFQGTGFGLYWLIAPDSGSIEYSIDGGPAKTSSSWDVYALKFSRVGAPILADGLPAGPHTVSIKISDKKADQSTGTYIRIGAFLTR